MNGRTDKKDEDGVTPTHEGQVIKIMQYSADLSLRRAKKNCSLTQAQYLDVCM